ncbi:MAG TPA: pre-peptidase C-terminal domain-containing protein [Pyrinomonadaceae bacterium]|nr:pre-peptidase C-terminal domain-containing protein [Pyrinomonadaceae bacterium]
MKRNLTRFLAIAIAVFFTLQLIQLSHAQKKALTPMAAPVDPRAEVKETNNTPVSGVRGGVRAPRPYATGSEVEPNDTSGTATALTFTPTAITSAAINPGGDIDFYTFTAPAGAKVWLETDTGGVQNAGATSRDTVVDLLAADGTTVIENDDDDGTGNGGDGTNETGLASIIAGATLTTGGTYFIRVQAFSATGIINPYRLFVSLTNVAATAEVEANDTAATANVANSPAFRSGSIGVAGDVDYYSISCNAGDTVFFPVDADPERDGTGTDLVVEFRDPADVILESVDSSITGSLANPAAEGANFTVQAAGTYFVKVKHFSATGTGTYNIHIVNTTAVTSPLVISEFRLRGPSGANDEFVEVYNNSDTSTTVASQVGSGFSVAASDAVVRCTIPNGTVIPGRGHYLCTNSVAYSLGGYATGDATYTTDIPDNAGIALFNNNVPVNFILANRLDAVGSTSEANTLYKEGTGYPALTPFSIDYAFVRDACGQQGSITNLTPCPLTTGVADTGNNAVDFYFVDTNGTSAGAGQRLGSPGPENLASPIQRNASFAVGLPDVCVSGSLPPNQIRDLTSVPAQNSTFGTIELRRTVVNNTGANVTRLRFRVTQQTTFPAPSGTADLRTRTTADTTDNFSNQPCGTGTSVITILGTTLEQPPSQPNGGAFNGTFSVGTVTLGTPIPPGNSVIVRFLWGVQQTGKFRVGMNIEVLP